MIAQADVAEYLDEIRQQVCSRCVERLPGGPPCAPLGKQCGIEMHLPQLLAAIHAVQSPSITPYLENNRRQICATCPLVDGDNCPCPMDYLAVLVVEAVETVDRRHNPDAGEGTQAADRESRVRAARVTLTVTEGQSKGQEFTFEGRTTCLAGRAAGCYVRFPGDPLSRFVSRYHCLLDVDPPVIRVRDLGSRNGTYLNHVNIGRRQQQPVLEEGVAGPSGGYPLADGDQLAIGHIVLQVHIADALPPQETPAQGAEAQPYGAGRVPGEGQCGAGTPQSETPQGEG